ncbi:MAG: hypothetical protein LC744_07495 [Chloroflexi bacterium]|nr:hypothetical protein [Chloroflexota bacterium]
MPITDDRVLIGIGDSFVRSRIPLPPIADFPAGAPADRGVTSAEARLPGMGFVLPPRTVHAAVVGPDGCTCVEGHRR